MTAKSAYTLDFMRQEGRDLDAAAEHDVHVHDGIVSTHDECILMRVLHEADEVEELADE